MDRFLVRTTEHNPALRDTIVSTPRGMRERRRATTPQSGRRSFVSPSPDSQAKLPFAVCVWNRRQRKQHQYTPKLPLEDVPDAMVDPDRCSSHRDLNWTKHTHGRLRNRTGTDKVTSLPPPDERSALAGPGRVPTSLGGGGYGESHASSRLVSHKQLQREKMAHMSNLHGRSYVLK